MKKILLTLAIAAVFGISGCSTVEEAEDIGAEENVLAEQKAEKTEKVEKAEAEPETEEEKTRVRKTVFIPHIVRETNYYSDGFIESYMVSTYDEDMNLVREDLFNSFDEIIESQVYNKEPDGTIERRLFNERGQLQSWSRTENNSDSEPLKVEYLDSEDNLQTVSEFEYDSQGNKTDWSVYNGNGSVLSRTKYLYEDGLNTKIEIFDASEELKEFFILEYSQGKLIRRSHHDEDNRIKSSIAYTYDDAGNLVEENYLRANGSVLRRVLYTNDERGNPVEMRYYDGNGEFQDSVERVYEYTREIILVWE